jgi:arsenate reductase (thioredoxin)
MTKILFVCVENACRSQMAEGFAREFGKGKVEAFSAGTHPSGQVNPNAIKAMQEAGIDISRQISKGFDALPLVEFDYVVTMGCGDECPNIPARQRLDWKIPSPKGRPLEAFITSSNLIKNHARTLLNTIK